MASRHHSLDMSELKDVTELLVAFQEQNRVYIKCRFEAQVREKGPVMFLTAECWGAEEDSLEVPPSASVSLNCSVMNLKGWNAVVTHALYALDFQLALNEFEKPATQRA